LRILQELVRPPGGAQARDLWTGHEVQRGPAEEFGRFGRFCFPIGAQKGHAGGGASIRAVGRGAFGRRRGGGRSRERCDPSGGRGEKDALVSHDQPSVYRKDFPGRWVSAKRFQQPAFSVFWISPRWQDSRPAGPPGTRLRGIPRPADASRDGSSQATNLNLRAPASTGPTMLQPQRISLFRFRGFAWVRPGRKPLRRIHSIFLNDNRLNPLAFCGRRKVDTLKPVRGWSNSFFGLGGTSEQGQVLEKQIV